MCWTNYSRSSRIRPLLPSTRYPRSRPCASSTPRTREWRQPWSARFRRSRAPWTRSSPRSKRAAGCSTSAPEPAAGSACSTPPRCPPTFSVPPELVQGIMAGGEAALSRATETTEDDPAIGVRDLLRARLHAAGRAGGNRRQRADALCAGRGGGSPTAGRGHGRDLLHARFGAVARRRYRDRAAGRARRSSPDPRA